MAEEDVEQSLMATEQTLETLRSTEYWNKVSQDFYKM